MKHKTRRPRSDPLVRTALRLQSIVSARYDRRDRRREDAMAEAVLHHARHVERQLHLLRHAQGREWRVAAAHCRRRLHEGLRQLQYATQEALAHVPQQTVVTPPSLRCSYEELQALEQEFGPPRLEDDAVAVTTDPITLQEIELGPFRIRLSLSRLQDRPDSSAFTIEALDAHPAAGNPSVVHPHVSDGVLCAGDATVPISAALAEGRLYDAFLCVSSVLHTYNPASPYVSLDEWAGTPCADCGRSASDDDGCDGCEQDYCCRCISSCDACDAGYCRGCLEQDRESGRLLCDGCRKRCSHCRRTVDPDSFDDELELCPACPAQHQQDQEEQAHEEQEQEEQQPI